MNDVIGASGEQTRVAVLSLHTSPLAQPGSGDSGGMNVYIRELVGHLAHTGAIVNVYVRRWRADLPDGTTTVRVDGLTYYYYFGSFYRRDGDGFLDDDILALEWNG